VGQLVSISIGPRRGLRHGISARTWYERGCALEASDPAAAVAAYGRAVAGQPDLADAHNNLGRLLHDRGQLADAEGCYRVALCNDRAVALYWFNLGVVVEDQGRHAEAVVAYQQAIAVAEGEPSALADAHFNLARLLEAVGRRAGDDGALYAAVRHLARYRALTRAPATRRR
jgi:tetratricopeptide (TPR) repeat protein